MSEPFGFVVRRETGWEGNPPARTVVPDSWQVCLPHQCETWDIAGEYRGVPHFEAVAALERFVAEAQAALEALRAERELNPDGAW